MAISINLFFAALLTILLPTIQDKFEIPGTLGFFAGLNFIAFILIFFLVAETRGLSLERLDRVYDNPLSMIATYQLHLNLPYLFKKYILRQRLAPKDKPQSYDTYAMEAFDQRERRRSSS